ncbi:MAG: tRNA (adenosine(37)-N6)-dimethylallyltransferase MiaA [Candidatus Sumerlaeaceae bacterium]|nr:tRNA (adenosine(37)-N6)-dimethylallyltransferase MiaA [Candidatus Sumerlaeaceae bacterium]
MKPDIIIVTGPTGIGKTAVAVELARKLETEIISADSMQVYRHLSIGTGKPTLEELGGVTCHLVDCVEPDYQYNLGDFIRAADEIIARLTQAGQIPIVCGGTGLYLRGLVNGVFSNAGKSDQIRSQLESRANSEGLGELYRELMRVDPGAKHIMPNDRQRILRALEVYYATGQPITALQKQSQESPRYQAATFLLQRSRKDLYARIDRRVDEMIAKGLLSEIRTYLDSGFSRDNPAFCALGYAEMADHLSGLLSLEDAANRMKQRSRNYAKRQLTWFKAMKGAETLNMDNLSAERAAEQICRTFEGR